MSSPRLVLFASVAVLGYAPDLLAAPLPPEQPLPVLSTTSAALPGNPVMPVRTAQSKQAPAAEDQDQDRDQDADQDQDRDQDADQDGDRDQDQDKDQDEDQPKDKD